MSNVEDRQKEHFIQIAENNLQKTTQKVCPMINCNLSNKESETINKIFNINPTKKYSDDCGSYIYYDGNCIACDKIHDRQDGQYISIRYTLNCIIIVSYKCFHSNAEPKYFFMKRNNPGKIHLFVHLILIMIANLITHFISH